MKGKDADMELRNIATFIRVAELRSFTQAANELGYVQSTVTAQIKQLESEIGEPLFDRIAKNISLTPMGLRLIPLAREMLRTAEEIASLSKTPAEISGSLRVGGLESLYIWLLAQKLLDYHERYPNVKLKTCLETQNELMKMLERGELDLVYLLDRRRFEPDLVNAFSSPVRIVFVAHPDSPLAKRECVELADIVEQPLVLTERNGVYRNALEELAAEKELVLSPFLEVNNTSVIMQLIRSGMGVSLLPEYAVSDDVDNGRLIKLDVSGCDIWLWRQVFYHKRKWVTPQMQKFIELIQKD